MARGRCTVGCTSTFVEWYNTRRPCGGRGHKDFGQRRAWPPARASWSGPPGPGALPCLSEICTTKERSSELALISRPCHARTRSSPTKKTGTLLPPKPSVQSVLRASASGLCSRSCSAWGICSEGHMSVCLSVCRGVLAVWQCVVPHSACLKKAPHGSGACRARSRLRVWHTPQKHCTCGSEVWHKLMAQGAAHTPEALHRRGSEMWWALTFWMLHGQVGPRQGPGRGG